MNWIKQNWIKVGVGLVVLVILFVIKGQHIKQSETAVISDTILSPVLSSEPDEDLPTIGSSEIPDAFDANGDYDKDKYSFLHGGIVGNNGKYTEVIVEDTPIEESVSVSYSNERHPLNLKSLDKISKIINDFKVGGRIALDELDKQNWQERVDGQLVKYGEIARQYLPHNAISGYYTIDIDNDGVKENLITICGIGSNHCSDYAEIVKGSEIIFSTQFYANSRGIKPAPNGFYIDWTDENSFRDDNGNESGLCCELSHHRTLFTFQNGQFIPIRQWEVPHIWKKVVDD